MQKLHFSFHLKTNCVSSINRKLLTSIKESNDVENIVYTLYNYKNIHNYYCIVVIII